LKIRYVVFINNSVTPAAHRHKLASVGFSIEEGSIQPTSI